MHGIVALARQTKRDFRGEAREEYRRGAWGTTSNFLVGRADFYQKLWKIEWRSLGLVRVLQIA